MFNKICKELDSKKSSEWEITGFGILDNNFIDSIYSNLLTLDEDYGRGIELLEDSELIHHLRKITKAMEFLEDFPFWRFWAHIIKFPLFIDFIDQFLMNIRKYNDLEKI